jgi:hypothetical protein
MRWRIVQTEAKTEVWVLNPSTEGTLVYGVKRGPKEPLNLEPGTEVYGIDKDIFDFMFGPVIRPALAGERWNVDKVLDLLERYLVDSNSYGSLLALMTGRIHIADQVNFLSSRLSALFIDYIRRLPGTAEAYDKLNLFSWAYQLTNGFFVSAKLRSVAAVWVRTHCDYLDDSFIEGLDLLASIAPGLLSDKGKGDVLVERLNWLKQEITKAKSR